MIEQYITNETSRLKTVILGIATDFGESPTINELYDPKSKLHCLKGTFPTQEDVTREMALFEAVLRKYDVEVLRPKNIVGINQIYSRDIGFVIDEVFILPNIIENRKIETTGIGEIVDQLNADKVIKTPNGVRIEGGDVMPWNNDLFVGYSENDVFESLTVSRTNKAGVEFLKHHFSNRKVHAFELVKSDEDPMRNALHLDCCFQPIGKDMAIIYPGGFKNQEDYKFLINYFGEENIIEITNQEMYDMNSNIFSISPQVIVSCPSFERLNNELERRGFTVEKVAYDEISKMEGLFRCSTLPLIRG